MRLVNDEPDILIYGRNQESRLECGVNGINDLDFQLMRVLLTNFNQGTWHLFLQ
jgi:hypothetical protein